MVEKRLFCELLLQLLIKAGQQWNLSPSSTLCSFTFMSFLGGYEYFLQSFLVKIQAFSHEWNGRILLCWTRKMPNLLLGKFTVPQSEFPHHFSLIVVVSKWMRQKLKYDCKCIKKVIRVKLRSVGAH